MKFVIVLRCLHIINKHTFLRVEHHDFSYIDIFLEHPNDSAKGAQKRAPSEQNIPHPIPIAAVAQRQRQRTKFEFMTAQMSAVFGTTALASVALGLLQESGPKTVTTIAGRRNGRILWCLTWPFRSAAREVGQTTSPVGITTMAAQRSDDDKWAVPLRKGRSWSAIRTVGIPSWVGPKKVSVNFGLVGFNWLPKLLPEGNWAKTMILRMVGEMLPI